MADLNDTTGSDLPSLSQDQAAAWAAEEAAANAARTEARGGGNQRIHQEPDHDGTGDPSTPPAPAAPAPAAAPAAATPAPAAPAADPDEDIADAVTDKTGAKYVPVAAHIGQRKALQGQVKDLEAALKKAQETNDVLMNVARGNGQPQAPAAAPAPTPAPEPERNPFDEATHPLEHERWERQRLEKVVQNLVDGDKKSREASEYQAALHQAKTAYVDSHRAFVAANPEYSGAYKFLTEGWARVAMAQNPRLTAAQANEAANAMEWQTVQQAVENKLNPNEVMWNIAKAAGFVAAPPPAPTPAAGAASTPAPGPSPAKQIELAQQGGAAAISLSDASGGSAPQPLTLASVASMSKEDFHARFSGEAGEREFMRLALGKKGANAA